jgi:hypothetical protein
MVLQKESKLKCFAAETGGRSRTEWAGGRGRISPLES